MVVDDSHGHKKDGKHKRERWNEWMDEKKEWRNDVKEWKESLKFESEDWTDIDWEKAWDDFLDDMDHHKKDHGKDHKKDRDGDRDHRPKKDWEESDSDSDSDMDDDSDDEDEWADWWEDEYYDKPRDPWAWDEEKPEGKDWDTEWKDHLRTYLEDAPKLQEYLEGDIVTVGKELHWRTHANPSTGYSW